MEIFKSKKKNNYFSINIIIISLLYPFYLAFKLLNINFLNFDIITFSISILMISFFTWIIYNLIKEHYIYKSNFISTKNKIIFHSPIYHKEIKWANVEKILIDKITPISSYLPYNKTRCIVLKFKNGGAYKIPVGNSYKNIGDFKKYLKKNFPEKIII